MSIVAAETVAEAAHRIHPYVRRTPLLRLSVPTPQGDRQVQFKLEQTQVGGSFKTRGILNMALRARERGVLPERGVVIASGGNAGIAAAVAGAAMKVPATVAVPHDSPHSKVDRLRDLGARVVDDLADHAESNAWADGYAERTGALRLHAYDDPDVVAGAGTILTEALEQDPNVDSVLLAVGGGGLVAGVATAAPAGVAVVGVEPQGAPTLHSALAAGRPVPVEVDTIAQDSLGARTLGEVPWAICSTAGVQSVLVDDAAITRARQWLWTACRLVVENAGACALAALLEGVWVPPDGSSPLIVICGANVDDPR
ncbi:serine/threonine dehydratase [Pseudactinotalea sp. Z1739]|uniref:serine/threonine dehydratase n=1 Tax=Pseudactinotalea sp. Z1739 TaxID=3413028 RepID=UPI003C7BFAB1